MLIGTKFALAAVIVLSIAATASAATKKQKIPVHRSGVPVQTSAPRPAPLFNPYSPAATGGGASPAEPGELLFWFRPSSRSVPPWMIAGPPRLLLMAVLVK